MHFPTPQGLSSPTFKQPPLDGTLLLPEILDYHSQNSPNHPLFRYADADGVVQIISWSHAVQAFHKVARFVHANEPDFEMRPVIGILASTDQMTYFSIIAGILRAGCQAFPVSPRNSDVAIEHLLRSTNCTRIFVSADAAMQKLAGATAARILGDGGKLKMIPIPTFEELFGSCEGMEPLAPMEKVGLDQAAVILHSSGSTAFPKTITYTHRILVESGLIPYYGQLDLCSQVLSVHAVPMFHLMGVTQLPWTAFSGLTIAVFPPVSPPVVPTPDRVIDGAIATKSTLIFCVPAFLESWATATDRVAALQKFKTVIFAGGPLQPTAGDMLVKNGVNIAHVYGLKQTTWLCSFRVREIHTHWEFHLNFPESPPKEGWDYFYFSPHADLAFVPIEETTNVYHLVAKKCATHTPAILDTFIDGQPALNTNDLLLRHPVNPKLWKVFGRQDDQIMHSNGEKTNPIPIEEILLKDPTIKYAVMFGRSKFHAGVLIFPAEPFDPVDEQRLVRFRREIWPTVEQANRFSPTHSRIFKEMILVADPSKPMELTAKGTLRRQAILDMYQSEIQNAYTAVEASSQTHLILPEGTDAAENLKFMKRVVAEVMLEMPGDDDDIFQHGCDSLQATWIRNSILHALQISQRKTVPNNFVYSYPTLRLLADLLTQLATGSASKPEDISRRADVMKAMAHKYVQEFPNHGMMAGKPETEVVLVTGTSGALGSHIIAQLLQSPEIATVYALNRPGSNLHDRQRASFSAQGVDLNFLQSPKLKLLAGDLNLPEFGLSRDDYDALTDNVTTIIHNAWHVNFRMSLSSMEPLIAGTRRLVDFSLSSRHTAVPRLIFVSTAGIFKNLGPGDIALEQHLSDPQPAIGLGYTESKWVAEEILETAAVQNKALFNPLIIRLGQLSGAANGAWNSSEWFPVLLRSSQLLGRLPIISGRASWVPIHHAAKAIVDMRKSEDRYLHINHPRPTAMSDILMPLSEALNLPLIPYSEWLDSLEVAASRESTASTNPGVRLIDFFRSYKEVSSEYEAFFPASLSNTCATKSAGFMLSLAPLSKQDVTAWVSYLRQSGYLS